MVSGMMCGDTRDTGVFIIFYSLLQPLESRPDKLQGPKT